MEHNGAEIRNNLGPTAASPATTSFGGGSSAVVGEPLAAAVAHHQRSPSAARLRQPPVRTSFRETAGTYPSDRFLLHTKRLGPTKTRFGTA